MICKSLFNRYQLQAIFDPCWFRQLLMEKQQLREKKEFSLFPIHNILFWQYIQYEPQRVHWSSVQVEENHSTTPFNNTSTAFILSQMSYYEMTSEVFEWSQPYNLRKRGNFPQFPHFSVWCFIEWRGVSTMSASIRLRINTSNPNKVGMHGFCQK